MPYKHTEELEAARQAAGDVPSASPVFGPKVAQHDLQMPGRTTLYESFMHSVKQYGSTPCLGARPDADSEYEWYTYDETEARVGEMAAYYAIRELEAGSRVGVFGANCREWMIAMQACNRNSMQVVPLYDTLGHDAVSFILEQAEVTLVVVAAPNLPDLADAAAERVKSVVYWGTLDDKSRAAVTKLEDAGASVVSWTDALAAGQAKPCFPVPPSPEDLCTIMYTSGTTGQPKGVMMTHKAVLSVIAHAKAYFSATGVEITHEDVFMSYLPLAHIFDRVIEEFVLSVGGCIGYWRGDIKGLMGPTGDLCTLAPTMFPAVPRVLDRVYSGFKHKIDAAPGVMGWVVRHLYRFCYSRKLHAIQAGKPSATASPLADALIFKKVKAALGGRVRIIASGGAPLSGHVEEFLRVAMCAPVVQGYGLTETCAANFLTHPDHMPHAGTVGPPLAAKMRLESCPELGYDALGTPPKGEVLIAGDCLFKGYYKNQEKTDEAIVDGWFHTGDIGEITPEGALRIIDRKKNMFKLAQGEYVAVEKIESVLKEAEHVETLWVYGNSLEASLVAVVVPKDSLHKKAAEAGVEVTSDQMAELLVKELAKTGKAAKLKGFELPRGVIVETEEFSVDNGLMTPKFSLKRPQLLEKYKDRIDALYDRIRR